MGQIRFQIGVPGAGSAARESEGSRERFRSLQPEAGSAARQAEEGRRACEAGGAPQPRMATIRMQGRTAPQPAAPLENSSRRVRSAAKNEESSISGATVAPYPDEASQAAKSIAQDSGKHTTVLPYPTPLQTAAAKVRSLFRSVFSEPAA